MNSVHTKTQHTPGPWAATTRQGSWDWVVYQENGPLEICQMFHDGTEFNEIGEANSKLVAAAPEMLKALKAAEGYMLNAKIDIETGTKKETTLNTLNGGLKIIRAALQATSQT